MRSAAKPHAGPMETEILSCGERGKGGFIGCSVLFSGFAASVPRRSENFKQEKLGMSGFVL